MAQNFRICLKIERCLSFRLKRVTDFITFRLNWGIFTWPGVLRGHTQTVYLKKPHHKTDFCLFVGAIN